MEKKTQPKSKAEGAIKAAAWAWYQHGGLGSDDTSIEEAGVRRINRAPKPSRFKLEAIKLASRAISRSETMDSVHTQNSLLDTYEIEMISKRFESLTQHVIDSNHQGLYIYDLDLNEQLLRNTAEKRASEKKKIKKLRIWSVCGSAADVLEPRRLSRRHRQTRN